MKSTIQCVSLLIPFSQKGEIEKIIKESLEVGIICPSASPNYPSSIVMVLKKEGTWNM
jgi:hypothetical protein